MTMYDEILEPTTRAASRSAFSAGEGQARVPRQWPPPGRRRRRGAAAAVEEDIVLLYPDTTEQRERALAIRGAAARTIPAPAPRQPRPDPRHGARRRAHRSRLADGGCPCGASVAAPSTACAPWRRRDVGDLHGVDAGLGGPAVVVRLRI